MKGQTQSDSNKGEILKLVSKLNLLVFPIPSNKVKSSANDAVTVQTKLLLYGADILTHQMDIGFFLLLQKLMMRLMY